MKLEDIVNDILDTLYEIKDGLQAALDSLAFNIECLHSNKDSVVLEAQDKSIKNKIFGLLGKKENNSISVMDYEKEIAARKLEYDKTVRDFETVCKDIEDVKNINLSSALGKDLENFERVIKRYDFPIEWLNEFDRFFITNLSGDIKFEEDFEEFIKLAECHAYHRKIEKPTREIYNLAIDFLILALKRYYDRYYNRTFILRTTKDLDYKIRIDLDHISSLCGVKSFPIRNEKTFMDSVLDGESHNYRMLITIIRKRDLVIEELLKREDILINPYSVIISCRNLLNMPSFVDMVFVQGSSKKNWNTCHDFLIGKDAFIISLEKNKDCHYLNNIYISRKGITSDITVFSEIFVPELMEVLYKSENIDVFPCDAARKNQERIVKKLKKGIGNAG